MGRCKSRLSYLEDIVRTGGRCVVFRLDSLIIERTATTVVMLHHSLDTKIFIRHFIRCFSAQIFPRNANEGKSELRVVVRDQSNKVNRGVADCSGPQAKGWKEITTV
jgi:hypothetical protein